MLLALFNTAHATNYPVHVGNTKVIIHIQKKGKGKSFVHVHRNETTALAAAKAIIAVEGGSLMTLVHSGGRNIVFNLHNTRYEFDPNRIFTDTGIRKTLTQYSGTYTPAAHTEVKKLADKIKMLLPEGKIIAVHNNQSYSFKDYLPGHNLANDAQKLHFHDETNYRNFYLVTKHQDFSRLKERNFNSILQADMASDDGSLSIYLADRNYVNVEAGYNQLAAQIKMLQYA